MEATNYACNAIIHGYLLKNYLIYSSHAANDYNSCSE